MYRVTLINMPFATVRLPSIALTQLKSVLEDRFGDEVAVRLLYLNHDFATLLGFGLYAATYLTPVYLGRVRDFSSLQIGTTVFVTGIAMTVTAPIAARLSTKVDGRYVDELIIEKLLTLESRS